MQYLPQKNANKSVIFKNCSLFTDYINEINNSHTDNAKDINVVLPMYNLIEYSDNYSKTSVSLWSFYKGEPALDDNGNSADFTDDNNTSNTFKFKDKIKQVKLVVIAKRMLK